MKHADFDKMYTNKTKVLANRRIFALDKILFSAAMLVIALFSANSEASNYSHHNYRASLDSALVASGVYLASHYVHHRYRKPYQYRYHYRPRGRHYYPRYRGYYSKRPYYSKRYYNNHRYGYGHRYRRHY